MRHADWTYCRKELLLCPYHVGRRVAVVRGGVVALAVVLPVVHALAARPAGPGRPAATAAAGRARAAGGRSTAAALAHCGAGRAAAFPLVDHQVDGHLALQAADVPVAEVIAEFVYLKRDGGLEDEAKHKQGSILRIHLRASKSFFVPSVRDKILPTRRLK
jgi:hypothetical protein